jgi:hypothetical protein
VKQSLTAWVDQEEEHHNLTMEALADEHAGCVIDHQASAPTKLLRQPRMGEKLDEFEPREVR